MNRLNVGGYFMEKKVVQANDGYEKKSNADKNKLIKKYTNKLDLLYLNTMNVEWQQMVNEKSVTRTLRLSKEFAKKTWEQYEKRKINKEIVLIGSDRDINDYYDRYQEPYIQLNPDKESFVSMSEIINEIKGNAVFFIMLQEWEPYAAVLENEGLLDDTFVYKLINHDINEEIARAKKWKDFMNDVCDKACILVTPSIRSKEFIKNLGDAINIIGIISGKKDEWGTVWEGYIIQSCYEITKQEVGDAVFVLCSVNWNDYYNRLFGKGFKHVYSLRQLCRYDNQSEISQLWKGVLAINGCGKYDEKTNIDNINKVIALLEDKDSIETFKFALKLQQTGDDNYDYITEDLSVPDPPYFTRKFLHFNSDEIYLDIGPQDGGTVNDFIKRVGNRYNKIYAWEIGKDSILKLNKLFSDSRIVILPYGAWDQDTEMAVQGQNGGRHLQESSLGADSIICKRIDDIHKNEKVSLIKMDIEGAEMHALKGAEQIIKKYKPKLMISIYHKLGDMWDIPLYIHDLVPEYKLYIRHHRKSPCDTVLYCIV